VLIITLYNILVIGGGTYGQANTMNMSKWIEASASNHDTRNYSTLRIWLQSIITCNISIIKNILKKGLK
jgi:hypothetical protein